ncbi:hypothetical protein ACIOC1_01420 [Streptomyces sp. NPDC088197]|uniref:hypothetical protein n=1 Tax=unclassified Streptomyces TaxID=2593676 RepID=UPI0036E5D951
MNESQVYEPLVEMPTSSALSCLIALRWSRAVQARALVLLDPNGEDLVAYPKDRAPVGWHPRLGLMSAWRAPASDARWVSLRVRECQVEPRTRGRDSGGESGRTYPQGLAWWVSDPAVVARLALTEDEMVRRIVESASLSGVWPGLSDASPSPFSSGRHDPGKPYRLDPLGVSFRFRPGRPALSPPPAPPALPSLWGADQHEAYRFYRDVVGGGPHGLAALWLLYHPDQAKDVLQWTVDHQGLLDASDSWEHSLASMLRELTGTHRAFIGVKFAEILSATGVPHGEETLDRVRRAQAAAPVDAPGDSAWRS